MSEAKLTDEKAVVQRILSAADILGVDDKRFEVVDVPEWGGAVRLQSLTGKEITEFVDLQTGKSKGESTARVLMLSAVDPDGNRLFQNITPELIDALKNKSMSAFMKLQHRALVLNGLADEVVAEVKKA